MPTYIVVNPSRSAVVLDLHFSRLYNIPVVVDGYAAYNRFAISKGVGFICCARQKNLR